MPAVFSLCSQWTDIRKILYLNIFRKCVLNIQPFFFKIRQEQGVVYVRTNVHL
jgi:hypothetical protein